MAAVAARMAAEEAEDRKGLIYDAGELRSRDLAVVGNISGMMMGGGGSMSAAGDSITTGGGGANSSASAATPSKARGPSVGCAAHGRSDVSGSSSGA